MDRKLALGLTFFLGSVVCFGAFMALPVQVAQPRTQSTLPVASEAVLPSNTTIPAGANITLVHGMESRTFMLEDIWNYVDNGSIFLHNYTYWIGGVEVEAKGINPLRLMEIAGWADCWTFRLTANDGYNKVYNTSDFIMRDGEYYKDSDNNASILCIAADDDWLGNQLLGGENYGNFYVIGDGFPGNLKVSNITTLTYESSWGVKVYVDGELRTSVFYSNLTTFNYTSYMWGYNANFSWPKPYTGDVNCTGVTVASIVAAAINATTKNYTVSCIAVDGYGSLKVFTAQQMLLGYAPGEMVDNGTAHQDQLFANGRQAMLMTKYDGENLPYDEGAFWLIIPGAQKGNYIKEIVEIRVTTTPFDLDGQIDGFMPALVLVGLAAGLLAIVKLKRRGC